MILDTQKIKNKKNLLAFSAGIDSSALFFLLIENNIKFDIAIVDYGLREQSKQEVIHAKKLAKTHKLFCHTIKAPLFDTHIEQKARDFRYGYFDSLVSIEGYDNVLTAHQLGDQLEWLLMRLTKGAGLSELIGLEEVSKRSNYQLIRPILQYSKTELQAYLDRNNFPYFIDESNSDEKYERNKFRTHFSNTLIKEYAQGIKRSFNYLKKDKEMLEEGFELVYTTKHLRIIKLRSDDYKVKATDLGLKALGYLLSGSQRQEITEKDSVVIGGIWAIERQGTLLYIAPYKTVTMPKEFKEYCRKEKIPNKIRPYLFEESIELKFIKDIH